MSALAFRIDDLPSGAFSKELQGEADVSIIFVSAAVGDGPRPHRHPYQEILILQSGRGRFVVGDEVVEAGAGEVLVVPAGVAHSFVSVGDEPLVQIDVHVNPVFVTEWL